MTEKLSFRIDNGVRNIEVNDNGDTITLKLGDTNFQKKTFELYSSLGDKIKIAETLKEETPENIQKIDDIIQSTTNDIDNWLGKDTCKKIFGDILPSMNLIAELFDAIIPYIEEYNENRKRREQQRMTRYNPNRKGALS